jgi:galactose mutarotase-like enzyme
MKKIELSNQTGKISAVILPDYGGTMAHLRLGDKDIFYLNEDMVKQSPILAGGCPVLFPFSGGIKDDLYTINGKAYTMPVHGLVKNASFAVSQMSKSNVKLYATNSKAQKDANYPFDFCLELDYIINENSVTLAATVCNESETPMPHTFGWHPYFTATDKTAFSLRLPMREYLNYITDTIHASNGQPEILPPIDNVYYNRTEGDIVILNQTDGYKAVVHMDEAYKIITVWSTLDAFVCVEPWLGMPNAINTDEQVRWVPPGVSETYTINIQLDEI